MKTPKRQFPRSVAKYIRKEKSRFRKSGVAADELSRKIAALYERFIQFRKRNS